MTLKDQVWQTLKRIPYPGYTRDLVSFGLVVRVAVCDGVVTVTLAMGHLAPETQEQIASTVHSELSRNSEIKQLEIEVGQPANARPSGGRQPERGERPSIRRVIAVGSGKGGVGKSTVAVNLGVALVQNGLRVGLMDADVYGPNVPRMLGVHALPPYHGTKIIPAEAYGLKMISIGLLVDPSKPLIWRGPMTDKLVRQFLGEVEWEELDALVVDLPPGTGDIALSLMQNAQPDGAVVVVTPQQVALDDARKAVGMFGKLGVNVLGVVENMSFFVCDECEKRHYLFGRGSGLRFAEELKIPLLGEVPLQPVISNGGDHGRPIVLQADSPSGTALREVASRVWQSLESASGPVPLEIVKAQVGA